MTIRLETSKRTGITNYQGAEISAYNLNWDKDIANTYPRAQRRTGPSATYNCHGFTFASRRTRVERNANVRTILADDAYSEVPLADVLPGDVVIYFSDAGDLNHSGIVVEAGGALVVPIVCSKWGNGGEFVHALRDCPTLYGPNYKFYAASYDPARQT